MSGVIFLTQANKSRLVVSAGCTGANTISQAKIYRPECSAQVALYSNKSHCTFASQYRKATVTSAWSHWYVGSTSKLDTLLGIVRNSQKLKRLYCTCIVLALLEIHLNSFYSRYIETIIYEKPTNPAGPLFHYKSPVDDSEAWSLNGRTMRKWTSVRAVFVLTRNFYCELWKTDKDINLILLFPQKLGGKCLKTF